MNDEYLAKKILQVLKEVLQKGKDTIGLHEPVFSGNEWNYVKECLDTGWVSSVGKYVDKLEQDLVDYTGVKRAIAVVNGTAALHICLKLVGVKPGDEVLVPALTFVATVNAVTYCNAIPHFVDSDDKSLGVDPNKLSNYLIKITEIKNGECFNKKTKNRIKAVLPMHTFGHSVDLDPLVEVCNKFKLELVEDAAESLGSFYKGRHTGNWGRLSALSFNGNKIVTTGGGGAVLTNDEELGKLAKHITTTAKIPHKWAFNHDMIGYNYRMPNINAALGCAQLENLTDFIAKKRALAERYRCEFSKLSEVIFFTELAFSKSNYWLNVLMLNDDNAYQKENIIEFLHNNGLMVRPAWTLMHKLVMFQDCPRMELLTAESIEKKLINIPSSANL